jgi:hypothetical protein
MSEASFNNFVDTINSASGAVFDHAKALEDIAEMGKIAENIKIGDVISQEQYDMLVSYNKELSKYFRILGDGSAIMVGDPLDLQQDIGKT